MQGRIKASPLGTSSLHGAIGQLHPSKAGRKRALLNPVVGIQGFIKVLTVLLCSFEHFYGEMFNKK